MRRLVAVLALASTGCIALGNKTLRISGPEVSRVEGVPMLREVEPSSLHVVETERSDTYLAGRLVRASTCVGSRTDTVVTVRTEERTWGKDSPWTGVVADFIVVLGAAALAVPLMCITTDSAFDCTRGTPGGVATGSVFAGIAGIYALGGVADILALTVFDNTGIRLNRTEYQEAVNLPRAPCKVVPLGGRVVEVQSTAGRRLSMTDAQGWFVVEARDQAYLFVDGEQVLARVSL